MISIKPICVGLNEAAAMFGIGTSLFLAKVAQGLLPRSRAIGNRAVWLVSELEAAGAELPLGEHLPPAKKRKEVTT